MARSTPEETFATAQRAMEQQDFDAFFACIDPAELLRITSNTMNLFLSGYAQTNSTQFLTLCEQHGFPTTAFQRLLRQKELFEEVRRANPVTPDDPQSMMRHSHAHMAVVREYNEVLKAALKAVTDIAGFTAALERLSRQQWDSGSVSTKLFVGETLKDVEVDGNKAWAKRGTRSWTEDVGFVKRKGQWFVRIIAQRPRKRA